MWELISIELLRRLRRRRAHVRIYDALDPVQVEADVDVDSRQVGGSASVAPAYDTHQVELAFVVDAHRTARVALKKNKRLVQHHGRR